MTCSHLIARLMNRYHLVVYGGAAILALTAGEMIMGDREVAGYFARNQQVSLNRKWEEDFMITRETVANFKDAGDLPAEWKDQVRYERGKLEFIGQMTRKQRDALLAKVVAQPDKDAIEAMYEKSYLREVPNWVPAGLRPRVHNWFQRKWPVEVWKGVQGRANSHFVAWIVYGIVVAFCLGFPAWLRKREESAGRKPIQGIAKGVSARGELTFRLLKNSSILGLGNHFADMNGKIADAHRDLIRSDQNRRILPTMESSRIVAVWFDIAR